MYIYSISTSFTIITINTQVYTIVYRVANIVL